MEKIKNIIYKKYKGMLSAVAGFSLIELLVVMAIMAILAGMLVPAAVKARKKANINKAKAEMASFASLQSMIYLDIGGYVDLNDLDNTTGLDQPIQIFDVSAGANGKAILVLGAPPNFDFDAPATSGWDGPYTTFQPDDLDKGTEGADLSYHGNVDANRTEDASVAASGGTEWGYPLDPWGKRYIIAYIDSEKVMVIYSGGADGVLDAIGTGGGNEGKIDNMDKGSGHAGDTTGGNTQDDLFYKFK